MMTENVQLLEWQVWVLAPVVTVLAWLLNLLANKGITVGQKVIKWHPGRGVVTVLLYILAGIAGWIWYPPMLPVWPAAWSGAYNYAWDLIQAVLPVVGAAVTIYNVLSAMWRNPAIREQIWRRVQKPLLKYLGLVDSSHS